MQSLPSHWEVSKSNPASWMLSLEDWRSLNRAGRFLGNSGLQVKKKSYQKILEDCKIPSLIHILLFQRKSQILWESWENHKAAGVVGITGEILHRGYGLIVGSCVICLTNLPVCLIQQGWPSSGAVDMAGGFSWLVSQSPKSRVRLLPGKDQWAEGTLRRSCQWCPPWKQPAEGSNGIYGIKHERLFISVVPSITPYQQINS